MTEIIKYLPISAGKYTPATRFENIIYTAGITPKVKGELIKKGKLMASNSMGTYKQVLQQAAANALAAAESHLNEGEEIIQIITMTVYIQAEQRFNTHAKVADFATDYLVEQLGKKAIGSRTTIGVSSLPEDAPVEVQLTAGVGQAESSE